MIQSQHSNVQVTIFVTCLNFAGTGSRILLHPLSSSRRVIPSRKIALNSNGEVNCKELARRPCKDMSYNTEMSCMRHDFVSVISTPLAWGRDDLNRSRRKLIRKKQNPQCGNTGEQNWLNEPRKH